MNLQTTYLGLSLAHPVIASASPFSSTFDGIRRLEDAGAAAIVTASVYEEEVVAAAAAGEAFGAVGAKSNPEVTSYRPPQPGSPGLLAAHLELIRRAAESVAVPLIASLNGITREGWTGIATELKAAGAAAIELDLFHLPFDPAETSVEVERRLVETVHEVCAAVDTPVAVKLFPYLTAPAHLAAALANAGASGIVLFNRYLEPDIDLEGLIYRPSLDLSTAPEIRLPLMWIAMLAGNTPLSLAGGRGITGPEEVIKYLLAGADAVQTASALLRHGPEYLRRLVEGLTEWIEARGAASVSEVRGRMRASPKPCSALIIGGCCCSAMSAGRVPDDLRDDEEHPRDGGGSYSTNPVFATALAAAQPLGAHLEFTPCNHRPRRGASLASACRVCRGPLSAG
jgi:dihydroorotate dehydrogenase (fumarate)